ncbi:MAG: hypothetical protein N4A59_12665 [Marinifilum sp.]|nr:hypothetical protein [Marinifilum sp.]
MEKLYVCTVLHTDSLPFKTYFISKILHSFANNWVSYTIGMMSID